MKQQTVLYSEKSLNSLRFLNFFQNIYAVQGKKKYFFPKKNCFFDNRISLFSILLSEHCAIAASIEAAQEQFLQPLDCPVSLRFTAARGRNIPTYVYKVA